MDHETSGERRFAESTNAKPRDLARRRRHHQAVIQAELRRLGSAQLDHLSTGPTGSFGEVQPPPAA